MVLYEEMNPQDVSSEVVKTALRRFFPSISSNEAKFLYHGTYNVFEVREEYIFRFPDKALFNQKGFDLIQREKQVLAFLRPHLSVDIPQFIYVSSNPKIPFVGYRKIPGNSLNRCFHRATPDQRKQLAQQLGSFLSELHSFEIYQAFLSKWPTNFTPAAYRQYWEKYFLNVSENLYSRFSSTQKEWVANLFTNFLEEPENFRFIPRVVHGDFDTSNILVDPRSFRITGIIDFEDLGVWDPAADFLFYDEGLDFIEQLLASYQGPLGDNLEQRMYFLENRKPLSYLLTGFEWEYPQMIDAGFKMLEERMKTDYPCYKR
ncbi:MAG: phosphotransferase family protein [Candidatus Hodarchaeales archaeon]|jgi:aminoglycoside 2''-phosphotransferase